MFHVSIDDIESLKKRHMVLKHAAQLKQTQPQDFKIPESNPRAPLEAQLQPRSPNTKPGLLRTLPFSKPSDLSPHNSKLDNSLSQLLSLKTEPGEFDLKPEKKETTFGHKT